MNTGLFYGSSNGATEAVANSIRIALGGSLNVYQNIAQAEPKDLEACDALILGVSTWNVGQLQADWEGFWPRMDQTNLSGKKVALFGEGDQVAYSDTYQDALGDLADKVLERGGILVGKTSPEGHVFTASKALRDGKFVGLCLDAINQDDKTAERVAAWVAQIKGELGLA